MGTQQANLGESVEWSTDLVLTWDPQGNLTHVSSTANALLGVTAGMSFADFLERVHAEDRQRTLDCWKQTQGDVNLVRLENRVASTAGTVHRVYWHLLPVREQTGRLISVIAAGRDVTSLYAMWESLRRTEESETFRRMAREWAHGLNNVLQTVLGNASVLAGQLPPDHPWRGIVDDIVRSADQAANLASQLLSTGISHQEKHPERDVDAGH